MIGIYTRLGAATFLALSLQSHAASLGVAQEVIATDKPIHSPPMGCSFPMASIPDLGGPGHHPVAQKPAPPPFNAVADAHLGPTRTVRFSYHFSGLQDILPPNFAGGFKILSTEVTVFEGPGPTFPKASFSRFKKRPGNDDISASLSSSVGELRPFQNQWMIRVTSKGKLHDAGKSARPATVTFQCDMQITDTQSPVPTLTQ